MYLSNFEAKTFFDRKPGRKVSSCARTWMYRRAVAAPRFLLMCTVSKLKRTQQTMLSFFLQQRSHEEKQMTVILGLELTNITCCSSSESDDKTIRPTVSTAVATFAWCMRRQSSLWNVTHYDSAKCIFNERLKQNPSTTRVSRISHKRTANWGK